MSTTVPYFALRPSCEPHGRVGLPVPRRLTRLGLVVPNRMCLPCYLHRGPGPTQCVRAPASDYPPADTAGAAHESPRRQWSRAAGGGLVVCRRIARPSCLG